MAVAFSNPNSSNQPISCRGFVFQDLDLFESSGYAALNELKIYVSEDPSSTQQTPSIMLQDLLGYIRQRSLSLNTALMRFIFK